MLKWEAGVSGVLENYEKYDPGLTVKLGEFLASIPAKAQIITPAGKQPSPNNLLPNKIYLRAPCDLGTIQPQNTKPKGVENRAWLFCDNIEDEAKYRRSSANKDAIYGYKNAVLGAENYSMPLDLLLNEPTKWLENIRRLLAASAARLR